MKQLLIIPNLSNIEECLALASEYNAGLEFNEFYSPDVLDNEDKINEIVNEYKKHKLPEFRTVHGAFFDVIPFSMDSKIKEISNLRIHQSIDAARRIGAKAVIFHTNYNPFLNSKEYIDDWIEINICYWSEVLKDNPDMNIYLENMFDTTPDIMVALSEELSKFHNFGVCLDYAHAFLSKIDPQRWAEKLGKYVKHIHINDNDGVSDLHQVWGEGIIDREGFYRSYEKYMNTATILVETSDIGKAKKTIERLKEEVFIKAYNISED